MKRILTICTFLLLANTVYAQNQDDFFLKGELLDSVTKVPLAFANIVVVNKNQGMASTPQGRFEILVKAGDSIQVSSVGYADYLFLVTEEMKEVGFIKTIEMVQEAKALADFELFQLSDNFYLRRKLLDTMDAPIRGVDVMNMPISGPPSRYTPPDDQPFQLFSMSVPLFQELSKNPKQARIMRKMEEADTFQAKRQKEREKYFNKGLVKRITRIDDRVIEEFMKFCNFLDGEILGKSEFEMTQKILARYEAFLKR